MFAKAWDLVLVAGQALKVEGVEGACTLTQPFGALILQR